MNGVRAGLGDLAGNHLTAIHEEIHRYRLHVLIAVGLVLVAPIIRHLLRRHRPGEEAHG